jgi:hypothetical protein
MGRQKMRSGEALFTPTRHFNLAALKIGVNEIRESPHSPDRSFQGFNRPLSAADSLKVAIRTTGRELH